MAVTIPECVKKPMEWELTYEEIEAKFREMVELRFSKEHTDKLIHMIMNVDKLESIRELIDMTIVKA